MRTKARLGSKHSQDKQPHAICNTHILGMMVSTSVRYLSKCYIPSAARSVHLHPNEGPSPLIRSLHGYASLTNGIWTRIGPDPSSAPILAALPATPTPRPPWRLVGLLGPGERVMLGVCRFWIGLEWGYYIIYTYIYIYYIHTVILLPGSWGGDCPIPRDGTLFGG